MVDAKPPEQAAAHNASAAMGIAEGREREREFKGWKWGWGWGWVGAPGMAGGGIDGVGAAEADTVDSGAAFVELDEGKVGLLVCPDRVGQDTGGSVFHGLVLWPRRLAERGDGLRVRDGAWKPRRKRKGREGRAGLGVCCRQRVHTTEWVGSDGHAGWE